MAQLLVHYGAFGLALFFSAPSLAQKPTEPPARLAAALADFRKTCASEIANDIQQAVASKESYRVTPAEAHSAIPRLFKDARSFSLNEMLEQQALLAQAGHGFGWYENARDCAFEVAIRHA